MATKTHPLRSPLGPNAGSPETIGVPTWAPDDTPGVVCPNCGAKVCVVTCEVKPPAQLRTASGRAKVTYMGCPACPWASVAVITAI